MTMKPNFILAVALVALAVTSVHGQQPRQRRGPGAQRQRQRGAAACSRWTRRCRTSR